MNQKPLILISNDQRFKLYILGKNQGACVARNSGINLAKSNIITFLDSDDEWLPQKLEKQIEFSQKNGHFRFIHSNEIWVRHGIRVNAPKKFNKSS
jgi:glycosyltransferase involved in cell wall biosynthesis